MRSNIADVVIALPKENNYICTDLIKPRAARNADSENHFGTDTGYGLSSDVIAASAAASAVVTSAPATPLRSTPPLRLLPTTVTSSSSTSTTTTATCDMEVRKEEVNEEVWFSRDQVFKQPRSVFFHSLQSPSCG